MPQAPKTKKKLSLKAARGLTAAALGLALCGAVGLNWSASQNAAAGIGAEAAAVETAAVEAAVLDPLAAEDTTVSAEAGAAAQDGEEQTANKNYGEAQLVSVDKDSGTEFFESARLARSKAQDEALDELKKALKSSTLTDAEKTELKEKLTTQVSNITLESKLETLIKAKGFPDCVAALDGEKATVTVMTENDALTADEVTRIRDVLLAQCHGMTAQDITIVEVK